MRRVWRRDQLNVGFVEPGYADATRDGERCWTFDGDQDGLLGSFRRVGGQPVGFCNLEDRGLVGYKRITAASIDLAVEAVVSGQLRKGGLPIHELLPLRIEFLAFVAVRNKG